MAKKKTKLKLPLNKNKNQLIILLIIIFAVIFFMRACSNDDNKGSKMKKYYIIKERLVVKPTPWDRHHSHMQLRECTYENGVVMDLHYNDECVRYLIDYK
jgi:hypothetical protein